MGRTPRSPKHTGRDRHLKGVRNKETLAWGLDDEDEDEAHDITPEHSPPQKPTKPRLTKADPELARLDAVLESGTDLQKANPEMAELRAHGVEALDEALLQRMEIAVARRPSKEELVANRVLLTKVAAKKLTAARRSLSGELSDALQRRPSVEAVQAQGVMPRDMIML